ncbi:MAG: ribonuclease H-like domain-containing protein [Candidatus Magasanikbacteria bacterium]|nr:ribonuclease H-like domain-containing protein [Candidatus Magasanikbacteria bacterium]
MNTVVFDIETIPVPFNELDEDQKSYLLKFAENGEDEEKIKQQMALWAPTNRIVAIGMLSVESGKGAVYFQTSGEVVESYEKDGIKYECGTEKEILEKFWKAISFSHKFVTFNGRGFDCPVLMLRSAMLGVKPTKNLAPYRYSTDAHVDLLEQLTFYNAYRKFNLDFYCKAFGIKSPKSNGVSGHEVLPMFQAGKCKEIAEYCAGDLHATKELYIRWKENLSF